MVKPILLQTDGTTSRPITRASLRNGDVRLANPTGVTRSRRAPTSRAPQRNPSGGATEPSATPPVPGHQPTSPPRPPVRIVSEMSCQTDSRPNAPSLADLLAVVPVHSRPPPPQQQLQSHSVPPPASKEMSMQTDSRPNNPSLADQLALVPVPLLARPPPLLARPPLLPFPLPSSSLSAYSVHMWSLCRPQPIPAVRRAIVKPSPAPPAALTTTIEEVSEEGTLENPIVLDEPLNLVIHAPRQARAPARPRAAVIIPEADRQRCPFCLIRKVKDVEWHLPEHCTTITNVHTRSNVLVKDKKVNKRPWCFRCLGNYTGHLDCLGTCANCTPNGRDDHHRHHTALCRGRDN